MSRERVYQDTITVVDENFLALYLSGLNSGKTFKLRNSPKNVRGIFYIDFIYHFCTVYALLLWRARVATPASGAYKRLHTEYDM